MVCGPKYDELSLPMKVTSTSPDLVESRRRLVASHDVLLGRGMGKKTEMALYAPCVAVNSTRTVIEGLKHPTRL